MAYFIMRNGQCWKCNKESVIVIPGTGDPYDANAPGICPDCLWKEMN